MYDKPYMEQLLLLDHSRNVTTHQGKYDIDGMIKWIVWD